MTFVQRVMPIVASDGRGMLLAVEFPTQLPFIPVRAFAVTKAPIHTARGGHAHRTCHQFLVALSGEICVEWDEGPENMTTTLHAGGPGLHIPPLVWAVETYASLDAILLVLASHPYEPEDYIDDRDEVQRLVCGDGA